MQNQGLDCGKCVGVCTGAGNMVSYHLGATAKI